MLVNQAASNLNGEGTLTRTNPITNRSSNEPLNNTTQFDDDPNQLHKPLKIQIMKEPRFSVTQAVEADTFFLPFSQIKIKINRIVMFHNFYLTVFHRQASFDNAGCFVTFCKKAGILVHKFYFTNLT